MYKKLIIYLMIFMLIGTMNVFAQSQVVPCQLTNADQDTIRLFPERTNYRSEFIRTDEVGDKRKIGGEVLYKELEKRLGDKWDPIWETKDIPYVFYEILKGQETIGWVFGANQGWPGADNSQLMMAFDLDERIQEFFYQKLPSVQREKLQTPEFYSQFIGLTLEHFYINEYLISQKIEDKNILSLDMIGRIRNPAEKETEGFQKTLRGMKKVLVYLDDFKFGNKIKKDEVINKTKKIIEAKVPLLSENPMERIKKIFPNASRYVVDLISTDPVTPVYVVYKDDVYKKPFVRGILLGYVLPLELNTAQGKFSLVISVGSQDKEKGKIQSLEINKTGFNQLKNISLVNFYAKDVLTRTKLSDEKIDKIGPLKVEVEGKDITQDVLAIARKELILVDNTYLHNLFKKDEIEKKIEDYLKGQKK
ncbi:MAG: hypothetical protein PHX78_04970 [bacterium]|nr:hypothetical protein [bacterium]